LCCCSSLLFATALARPSIQELLDAAEPNAIIIPEPGIYRERLVIRQPVILDGGSQVTIDAGGSGSVITIATSGATVKGLRLVNSGDSHNDLDAGVQVRGDFNVIKDNRIEDCLFGVDLQQSSRNLVRSNRISSKDKELGVRGDAIRLWYSFENRIEENQVSDSRDIVVWYSADNILRRNRATRGRYSMHFMYSRYNLVEQNEFIGNAVGIFLMYSDGVKVRDNLITHAAGPTGVGIGFKETSDVEVIGNRVLHCATGMYLDVSPYQPDTINRIEGNVLAYNGIGVRFLNDWTGNEFRRNLFKGNLSQVVVTGGKSAARNLWDGNYWDDYEGFDRDLDGVGDSAYELYGYADRLWMDVPTAQFYKATPMLEVLDFLERLAPFSDPSLVVRDPNPQMVAAEVSVEPSVAPTESESQDQPDSLELLRRSLNRDS